MKKEPAALAQIEAEIAIKKREAKRKNSGKVHEVVREQDDFGRNTIDPLFFQISFKSREERDAARRAYVAICA